MRQLIVTICLIIFVANCNATNLSNSIAKFTTKLYKHVVDENNKNFVISPASVQMVLSMLLLGSNGNTQNILKNGLDLIGNSDLNIIANNFHTLLSPLQQSNSPLKVANKIYLQNNYQINPNYNNLIEQSYFTCISTINFHNQVNAVDTINQWVAENTGNLIQKLVSTNDITPNTIMVLLNAIFFKGIWQTKFQPQSTYDGHFFSSSTSPSKLVKTMHSLEQLRYANIDSLNAEILEIPYTNGNYAFNIILPKDVDGLSELENQIASIDLISLRNHLSTTKVRLSMPKFKTEFDINLNNALKKLGLGNIFSGEADFSGIPKNQLDNLQVSDVIQKAFIEVDEEGTKAAAATAVIMRRSMRPGPPEEIITFNINHPFIYFINNSVGDIYFIGRYVNVE